MASLFLLQMLMEELEPEERFLQYARNGDLFGIQRLLVSKIKEETQININCKGNVDPLQCSQHKFPQNVALGGNNISHCLPIVR